MRLVDIWIAGKLVHSVVMYQDETVSQAIERVKNSIVITSNVSK